CATARTFSCKPLKSGCEPDDSGPPPGPPLNCTTSNGCPGEDNCCYDANRGSVCKDRCSSGDIELCQLGVDRCGEHSSCVAMTPAPAPGVGQCRYTGGGS